MMTIVILGGILIFWQRLKTLFNGNKVILAKLDELGNEIKSLKEANITIINDTIYRTRINSLEAELRNKNISQNEIPEKKEIGVACGSVIEPSDIESVERLKPSTNSTSANVQSTNDPEVLVKFPPENARTIFFNGYQQLPTCRSDDYSFRRDLPNGIGDKNQRRVD
jgi:hypothetical protein